MALFFVLVYIALNLLSPADMVPAIAPFRPLLILGIAALPLTLLARLQSPEIGKLRTQLVLVLLFYLYAAGSWLPHGWFGGVVVELGRLGPSVLVYFVGVVLFRTPARLAFLRAVLVSVAIFVIARAFLELPYARLSGMSTDYVLAGSIMPNHVDDLRIRGLGLLHDPNVFGQFILMILPMLFVARRPTGMGIGYVVVLPLVLLLLVGVYLTGSRGTEVGVAVLVGLYLTWRFKAVGGILSAIFGSFLLLVINLTRSRTISMSGGMDRLAIWSDGMQFFKYSPLWGIGAGGFADKSAMTAHNSYLLCAAELGMIGYFLWMGMIVVTLIQLKRVPKAVGAANPAFARWAVALRLSLGVYMFTSFFLSRAYDLPLFLLLGMSGGVIGAVGGDEAVPLRGTMWPVWTLSLCLGILILIYILLRLRV